MHQELTHTSCGLVRVELGLRDVFLLANKIATSPNMLQGDIPDGANRQIDNAAEIAEVQETMDPPRRTSLSTDSGSDIASEYTLSTTSTLVGPEINVEPEPNAQKLARTATALLSARQADVSAAVCIRAAFFSRDPCELWCSCRCHKRKLMRSPQLLEPLLGTLFIGYSGLPVSQMQCDQQYCHSHSQRETSVAYIFPQWFLAQMISLVVTQTPQSGLRLNLRCHRAVSKDAALFQHAKLGEIQKLMNLFEVGAASPNDVHYDTGATALDVSTPSIVLLLCKLADVRHFAISHQRFDTVKFLLQAGADPFLNKKFGGCAADKAWGRILSKTLPPDGERALRLMFSQTEALERREFSVLHKIVIDLVECPLETELAASTADINAQDSLGRTAVSLAAERGDFQKVSVLLSFGADPNIPAHSGSDPLCYVARAQDPATIPLLLKSGARLNAKTSYGQTAQQYAAAHGKNHHSMRYLLAAGADPNAADKDGRTPLGFTPILNYVEVAACLLEFKANIRTPGAPDVDPLVLSIRSNRHSLLDLFIRHGFDAAIPLSGGQTLLHVLASDADEDTLRLFHPVDLSDLPIGKLDESGRTASEIFDSRSDKTANLSTAFYALMEHSLSGKSEGSQELEVWQDALEYMP